MPFITSSVNIALPTIGKEFHVDAVLLSWVPTSYLLSTAMCLMPFGRAGDIYGRKKIFLYGMIVYSIGSLFSALSVSIFMLIACRVIQGIGCAMAFGIAMAILTSVYPPKERGRAIGIVTASVYSGLSLGPVLGGILTQHLGWRCIFWINVPLGSIVVILILWRLKEEWAESRGEPLDLPGSILYALTLFLVMYGLSRLPSRSGIGFMVAGGIGAFIFFSLEARTARPILDVRIFKGNPVFVFSNLAGLIHYSSTYAVSFMLSLYLQYIKGLSAQSAGLILICQPIMIGLFSPLSGRLSDRLQPRVISSIGMAFTCLGIYLLSFIMANTGLPYIVSNLLILGFGVAFFSSPNSNAVMSSVDRRHFGVASGTISTMRVIGSTLSLGVVMMIFSMIIGKDRITPDLYPLFLRSVKLALLISGTLCIIGIFSSLKCSKTGKRGAETI
ncbi:MAG: MFS transporter [Deltaproteobacteria bacterium]|nr:MFS transporter [Deltaproteobacteria bacterium]